MVHEFIHTNLSAFGAGSLFAAHHAPPSSGSQICFRLNCAIRLKLSRAARASSFISISTTVICRSRATNASAVNGSGLWTRQRALSGRHISVDPYGEVEIESPLTPFVVRRPMPWRSASRLGQVTYWRATGVPPREALGIILYHQL